MSATDGGFDGLREQPAKATDHEREPFYATWRISHLSREFYVRGGWRE
jgi:hypothetical protein